MLQANSNRDELNQALFSVPFRVDPLAFLFPDPLPNAFDGKSHRGGLQGTFCDLETCIEQFQRGHYGVTV